MSLSLSLQKAILRIGIIPADEIYPANFKRHLLFSGGFSVGNLFNRGRCPLINTQRVWRSFHASEN